MFGESLVVEETEIDYSLTYSTASEKSLADQGINNENNPHPNVMIVLPPGKAPSTPSAEQHEAKKVTFAVSPNKQQSKTQDTYQLDDEKCSPLRHSPVKETELNVSHTTISVDENFPIRMNEKKKPRQAPAPAKAEWQEQISEARHINNQLHDSRLRLLALRKQYSSQGSREKARRHQDHKSKVLIELEKESQFKSLVYREHREKLRKEEIRRRRISIEARAKLRENAKKGKERLMLQRIDEDMAIIEERHESSVALNEKKANDAAARRKSFAFRNGDARRIRELHKLMEAERLKKEHEDFSLVEEANRDADEYKRKLQECRRRSLAIRNAEAAKQRKEDEARRAKLQEEDHKSFELKFEADRDVEEYKKQLSEERRLSFQNRNAQARRQRDEEQNRKAVAFEEESKSFELKRLGDKDVDMYKKELSANRRASLQNRGQEVLRQRRIEEEQKNKQAQESSEYFELKRQAEKDCEKYLKQIEASRRQSLAFRNEEGRRIRENETRRINEEFMKEHESYELKWAAERDAEAFRKELDKARRESLVFREKEAVQHRLKMSQEESRMLEEEHASYELKRAASKDVEDYKKSVEAERRKSLENRNAERARHANVMKELRQIAQEKESESYALKWSAENDVKEYLAKVEQERRESLQLRGKQVLEARKVEEEMREKELIEMHEDEKFRAEDSKAIKEYKKECAERQRHSLEYRGKEITRQRLERKVEESIQQQTDHKNFELECLAQKDVENYLKECRRRRRMSLAFRAKEKRRHAEWKRQQEENEIQERHRLVHGRLLDQRYVELALQEEKAKRALEAIRHTSRTSNPFSGLL